MEDKQLNLNQPLLSVRRISSTTANIGKDEKRKTDNSAYNVPRLPSYKSELKSGPVSNPGVVPFIWEQSPGRPKDEKSSQIDEADRPPIVPKLPPGRACKAEQSFNRAPESPVIVKSEIESVPCESQNSSKKMNRLKSFGSSNEAVDVVEDEENYESADEDETYVDALDALSRTESFFLNCSISGLSGLEEPTERNSLGNSPTDSRARDFMIDRFLPAAKAMASEMTSETPQYAPKKQPAVVQEQPRQLKKAPKVDKRPQLRYGPSFAQHYYQSHDYAGEGSDDEDDNELEYLTPKVCGLLPRFCLKGSFLLMNPVPGLSVRTRVPMSPISRRTQTQSSSAGSCNGTENERSISDVSEQQTVFEVLTAEPQENKNDLEDEFNQKTTNKINDHKLKTGFSTQGKTERSECENFQELESDQSNATQEDSANPAVEKTVYVDTVHEVESAALETKGPSQSIKEDIEILTDDKKDDEPLEDFHFKLNVEDKRTKIKPVVQEAFDPKQLISADKLNSKDWTNPKTSYGKAQFLSRSTDTKPNHDWKGDETFTKKAEVVHYELPIPPPLPQSPSESWLCRTLPSLPTKNQSLRPYLGNGNPRNQQAPKVPSGDPKWQTMVKTTKGHHHHLRYSEELMTLTPIPETQ